MRLDGLRVLDLTRLLPGPFATQLLADLGVDVIKIEQPGSGDYARVLGTIAGSDIFTAVNRGKRSVTLDLSAVDAREAFYRLAADADVLVESFRPGVADRLGIDYETIRSKQPGIVYCSLSGFGATGPHRDRAGHDLNYLAMSGVLDMTRERASGRPAIPGVPIADLAGGLCAAYAILGGLLARELGDGSGEYIDLSLIDVLLALAGTTFPEALAGGDPQPRETPLTGQYPCYDVYETADGEYITLTALEPSFWRNLCETIDRPDLATRQYEREAEAREDVREELAEVFQTRTRDEWEERLGARDVMVAPVNSPRETFNSGHAATRELFEHIAGRPWIASPLSQYGGSSGRVAPELGEHTAEVLREAGVGEKTIEALSDGGR